MFGKGKYSRESRQETTGEVGPENIAASPAYCTSTHAVLEPGEQGMVWRRREGHVGYRKLVRIVDTYIGKGIVTSGIALNPQAKDSLTPPGPCWIWIFLSFLFSFLFPPFLTLLCTPIVPLLPGRI